MSQDTIYLKAHPVDEDHNPDKDMVFCISEDMFVPLPEDAPTSAINRLNQGAFFYIEDRKCRRVRNRKIQKEVLLESGRSIQSGRLLAAKPRKRFAVGEVVVTAKPHKNFFHKPIKDSTLRYLYDPLNNKFYCMDEESYKKQGFPLRKRGALYEREKGNWKELKGSVIKIPAVVGHKEIASIKTRVENNLMLWKANEKIDKKCKQCRFDCKQPDWLVDNFCKKYKRVYRRKTEINENE